MDWIERFPGLATLEPAARAQLVEKCSIISVAKDTVIFGPGKAPEHLLLLLHGSVRVQQLSEKGREIVLYRVGAGESCVLTTACLLAFEDYSATGITESEVAAVAMPRQIFDQLMAQSAEFRRFVFTAFSKRITDLFLFIEEVAFQRLDVRLAQKLIELAEGKQQVKTTHQKLAAELGSAREVVSRQLQEFQRRQWVAQSRGTIELLDIAGLQHLADT